MSEVSEMSSSDVNLVATIIGFGMCAAFVVFVCTRLLCGDEIDSRADLEQAVAVAGVEAVVIAAIPTMKFHHEDEAIEDAQCSICLEEYEEEQVLRIMPKCGHNFHLHCIDTWLLNQSTCPLCRLSLQQDSIEPITTAQEHVTMNIPQPGE